MINHVLQLEEISKVFEISSHNYGEFSNLFKQNKLENGFLCKALQKWTFARASFSIKKFVLTILMAVVLLSGAFSFDFGLSVDSISGLDLPVDGEFADSFTQRIKAALWAETGWTAANGNDFTISGQGIYVFTNAPMHLFDLERLVLQMRLPELFSGAAIGSGSFGRFRYTDPTGYILNHPIDGARFSLDLRGVEVSLGAGYTGLLLKAESGIRVSEDDDEDLRDNSITLSPKRLFQGLDVAITSLIPRQRISLGFFAQQDLRATDKLNSIYGHLGMNGPIFPGFFYSVTGALSSTLNSEPLGLLGDVNLTYFLPQAGFSRFALGFLVANEEFAPLSVSSVATVGQFELQDLGRLSFSYSLRPWGNYYSPVLRNLGFEVDAKSFFQVSEQFGYQGSEFTAGINFRPANDLGFSLSGGAYVPQDGDVQGKLQLLVSLGL